MIHVENIERAKLMLYVPIIKYPNGDITKRQLIGEIYISPIGARGGCNRKGTYREEGDYRYTVKTTGTYAGTIHAHRYDERDSVLKLIKRIIAQIV